MTLTVGELKKQLKNVDDSRIVVMAKDSEGNGYSPLRSFWEGMYRPDSTYSGEVGFEGPLTEEDEKAGYTEEDILSGRNCKRAIILAPTN